MRLPIRSYTATLFLAAALELIAAGPARAIDLYNNLSQSAAGGRSYFGPYFVGLSFKTTATETVLTSLSASLQASNGTSTGTTTYSIYNATGSGGLPGTKITDAGTINNSSLTSTYATFSISSLNIALSASTNYWLVLSSSTNDTNAWAMTSSLTGTTGSTGVAAYSSGWSSVLPGYYAIGAVTAVAAVPEPSTYALATIATGVLAWAARRRKAIKG